MTLRKHLDDRLDIYQARAGYLEQVVHMLGERSVAAFVLFTPQQKYEHAVRAWKRWQHTGEVTELFANRRRSYIDALPGKGLKRARK